MSHYIWASLLLAVLMVVFQLAGYRQGIRHGVEVMDDKSFTREEGAQFLSELPFFGWWKVKRKNPTTTSAGER